MNNKMMEKWVNIFNNEDEFCSGELSEELGIYIFEDEKGIELKGKNIKCFYIKDASINKHSIHVNAKLDDSLKYDYIKKCFFRILENKASSELFS